MMARSDAVAIWMRRTALVGLVMVLVALVTVVKTGGVPPAGHVEIAQAGSLGDSGTIAPAAQVARLWRATRPVLLAAARTPASDEEYLRRRAALLVPWVRLQSSFASAGALRYLQDVVGHALTLISDLYGAYHYYSSPEQRAAARERARRDLDGRLGAIDQEVAALPGLR